MRGFQVSRQGSAHSTLGLRKLCPAKRASSPSSSSILRETSQKGNSQAEGPCFSSQELLRYILQAPCTTCSWGLA